MSVYGLTGLPGKPSDLNPWSLWTALPGGGPLVVGGDASDILNGLVEGCVPDGYYVITFRGFVMNRVRIADGQVAVQ